MPMASDSSGTHPMALELGGVLRHEACPHAVQGVYRKPSAVLLPGFCNSAGGLDTSANVGRICAEYVGFESEVLEQDLDPELWGRRPREGRIAELLGSQRWVSCMGGKRTFRVPEVAETGSLLTRGAKAVASGRALFHHVSSLGHQDRQGRRNLALFG